MVTTANIINEALSILRNHDWYWMMADYGYEAKYNAAKASMRSFVSLVKTIDNNNVRDALRNLWMLHYEHARNSINGHDTENYEARKTELVNMALAA